MSVTIDLTPSTDAQEIENALTIWVVYENPSDYPGKFVVRRQLILSGGRIGKFLVPDAVADDLETVRAAVPAGLVCLMREDADDPVIVETWM